MCKFMKQLLSIFLALVLVINLLPLNVLSVGASIYVEEDDNTATTVTTSYERGSTVKVVAEDTSKRSEYYKEFVLNNGLRMATVYPYAVHYKQDGKWEEIDNTLKTSGSSYVNTAGKWAVSFPQKLSNNNTVTIQKDGYTLNFCMSGELHSNNTSNLERASLAKAGIAETFSIQSMQTSSAHIDTIDLSKIKSAMEHPEIIPQKNKSRLQYSNVYSGTNIVYDLSANQVKESIIMQSYSANLRGYRYTLNVGELQPILNDSGEIFLYDRTGKEVIMTMPAPFLVDDVGECCYDVVVTLTGNGSNYTLTYLLPQDWLADSQRQWPVVLDPVVDADITRSNIRDVSVYERYGISYNNAAFLDIGHDKTYGITRAYLKYDELPTLTSADVVVDAKLMMCKYDTNIRANAIEVHKVCETWASESLTWGNQPDHEPNSIIEDYVIAQDAGWYQWTITDVVRGWYANGNTGLLLKAPNWVESITSDTYYRKQFYSSDNSADYRPVLTITFRNNNGLENYWDYTASTAGRAGTGYVNNYAGNLVWVHNDIGYGGNRMPVSISHIYNSNDATIQNEKDFGMGKGWRTNFNQTVSTRTLPRTINGVVQNVEYYVWEDSDGTRHYFYQTAANTYQDEDGLDLTIVTSGNDYACELIDKQGNKSYFDSHGRLYKLKNNQQTSSSITITYTTTAGNHINTITDGANRVYRFTYSGGLVNRISYTGTGNTEIGYLTFSYSNGCLTTITSQDNDTVHYEYDANHLLTAAEDIDGYRLEYTYHSVEDGSWQPYRVNTVSEHDGSENGGMLTIQYGHNQTSFTDHNNNVQIMQFNNWGNTVSIQDNQGRAQFATYSSVVNQTDKGNQLRIASKLQNTVSNMLQDSSFENGTLWSSVNGASREIVSGTAYLGNKSLKFKNNSGTQHSGITSSSVTAEAGKSYTFSAYIKTDAGARAYLLIGANGSSITSEILPGNTGWTRVEITYTNNTGTNTAFTAQILSDTSGWVYVDCVQLEKAETASRYNIIENGDFRYGNYNWIMSQYCDANEIPVTWNNPSAPQLESTSFQIVGDPQKKLRIRQEVPVSGVKDDVYVLAAWAQGDGVPLPSEQEKEEIAAAGKYPRTFTIRGNFLYTDGTLGVFNFDFNPDQPNWQYAAGVMIAEKAFSGIKIQVLYDYNANTAYFDGIQLYKEEFGSSYTYDQNGNVTSVKDLQGGTTSYQYENNNLKKEILPTGTELSYTYYANSHNVKTATTAEGSVYNFTYDTYGNNTSISITSDGVTMTSTAEYTNNGNYLDKTIDAAGNETDYTYDANTGVLLSVKYPNDSDSTKTTYTYDSMYRATRAQAKATGIYSTTGAQYTMLATYGYTDDRLTSITTPGAAYTFTYGNFGLRTNVKVGGQTLAAYEYTSDGNHDLSSLTYGNGDEVQYTYDSLGRITKQTYEDGATVSYRYNNDGRIATVTDSASGQTTTGYYDYADRLVRYKEKSPNGNQEVYYSYDALNKLSKREQHISNVTRIIENTYDDDNRLTYFVSGNAEGFYDYDNHGRLSESRMNYQGNEVYKNILTYRGVTATTDTAQVQRYQISSPGYNVMFTYTYDQNGNILMIRDGTYIITYQYDEANQLVRENNPKGGYTYLWTYDANGNIENRREFDYTTGTITDLSSCKELIDYHYANTAWKDLLTGINDRSFTYDAIGNTLTDGVRTYTWRHGRELATVTKSGTTWTNTYNADGLRVKRTNGTKTYTYTYLDGALTRMAINGADIFLMYDAMGTPKSISYNGTTYLYVTNLQGDVIAVLTAAGQKVVEYSYDAWGNVLSVTGSMSSTLGRDNPLRYRGYIYDTETELYYLQSRYYNPEIGRFINADSVIAGVGGSTQGYNMFAYCFNNPVNMSDSTGNWPTWIETAVNWVNDNIVQPFVGFFEDIGEDFKNYDSNNQSEDVVFSSNYFSNYNGALVVKTPFDASFSFGFIGLSIHQQDTNTLKHEYGHVVQMENMGLVDYTVDVAIPSITINMLDRKGKLKYSYYGAPWEAEADILGGVNRTYNNNPWPKGTYTSYWDLIKMFWE